MSSSPPGVPPPETSVAAVAARRRLFDLARIRRDATRANWSLTTARAALLCLPVIAAWIFAGVVARRSEDAMNAIAGAVTVGFGAFQYFGARRAGAMLWTIVGLAAAAWIGSVAGWLGVAAVVASAAGAALLLGAMTTLGYSTWWIALQWMIVLQIYGAHPSAPAAALRVAAGVVAGAATQWLALALLFPLTDAWYRRQPPTPQPAPDEFRDDTAFLLRLARGANPLELAGRYALRVAIAVGVATFVSRRWPFSNSYWIPMTAAILLKPDLHETAVRGVNRLVGTLVGAGVTTLVVALLRPSEAWLGLLLLAAIYGCFALQRVHYAFFAGFITAYVVLLLSLIGLPEPEVALHRVAATLAGAAVALAVHLLPMERRPQRAPVNSPAT